MSTLKFADTHNLVAFLEKPEESNGFEEIIDFLNASSIHYALMVNPTIYTSCFKQFWAIVKVKAVNGERQLQALVDKKKVIIIETSIRSDLNLEDASGIDCLPTATIYEELARIGYEKPSLKLTFYKAFFSPQWKFLIHTITQCLSAKTTAWNEFSSTMASAIICLATNQKFNLSKYIFDAMLGDMSHHKKTYVNPSHTKKIFANMKKEGKDFSGRVTPLFATMMVQANQEEEPTTEETPDEAHSRVLALETTKYNQALEIESLKKRVKSLEKRRKSRTPGFKRLRKGRKITDLDVDAEVTLVDETQEMNDGNLMFDTDVLEKQEKDVDEKEVSVADPVTTASEVVTTANVEVTTVNAPTTIIDELTLAYTLIEIKAAKPKVVTSVATTTTTTRPKARGVVVQEPTLRAQEKRSKPPTKVQKRNTMSTYLKNMAGYKHNQLKSKSYDEIQEMFDKEMKRENTKKQKGDDDQEEVEMKRHIKIVKDDEVAIDAIPLATKPLVIVDYKIDKDGRM
ncbi:hypothetical protein Tco_1334067 [Tanacetum coccineum]